MRYTMTTLADLRNWADDATSNWPNRTDAELDAIVTAIQTDGDRPNWGEDWTDYLDALPDLTAFLPVKSGN